MQDSILTHARLALDEVASQVITSIFEDSIAMTQSIQGIMPCEEITTLGYAKTMEALGGHRHGLITIETHYPDTLIGRVATNLRERLESAICQLVDKYNG